RSTINQPVWNRYLLSKFLAMLDGPKWLQEYYVPITAHFNYLEYYNTIISITFIIRKDRNMLKLSQKKGHCVPITYNPRGNFNPSLLCVCT
ncbi:hypothetical protein L9F63_024543, partial [Diploptera punctata]